MIFLTKERYSQWFRDFTRERRFSGLLLFSEEETIARNEAKPWKFYLFRFGCHWLYIEDGKLKIKQWIRFVNYGWCRD